MILLKKSSLIRSTFLAAVVGTALLVNVEAIPITVVGDPIFAGQLGGGFFTIADNSPAEERVPNAIDGNIFTKYLNFGLENTGYFVTPNLGSSIATGINFNTANDEPGRDPSKYSLFGSNNAEPSSGEVIRYSMDDFSLISSGNLSLSNVRRSSSSISFSNTLPFESYILVFPSTKNSNTIMQIADAVLTGTQSVSAVPDTGSTLVLMALSIASLGVIGMYRRSAA